MTEIGPNLQGAILGVAWAMALVVFVWRYFRP